MIHKNSDTPTEPETAKMPDGVEKTCRSISFSLFVNRSTGLTSSTNHLVQNDEHSRSVPQFLTVIVDKGLVCLHADILICIAWRRR